MWESETDDARAYRLGRLEALLNGGARDLTQPEYASVLPPRGPSGCADNLERGRVIRQLNDAGFTVFGARCK